MGRPAVFGAADASERASEMFLRTGAFFSSILSEFLKNLVALQVDLPILCWGPDMIWNGNAWNLYRPMQSADSNDNRYRVNSYRVLLTRGRDGLLVFVPPESKLSPIYDLLCKVGLEEL